MAAALKSTMGDRLRAHAITDELIRFGMSMSDHSVSSKKSRAYARTMQASDEIIIDLQEMFYKKYFFRAYEYLCRHSTIQRPKVADNI